MISSSFLYARFHGYADINFTNAVVYQPHSHSRGQNDYKFVLMIKKCPVHLWASKRFFTIQSKHNSGTLGNSVVPLVKLLGANGNHIPRGLKQWNRLEIMRVKDPASSISTSSSGQLFHRLLVHRPTYLKCRFCFTYLSYAYQPRSTTKQWHQSWVSRKSWTRDSSLVFIFACIYFSICLTNYRLCFVSYRSRLPKRSISHWVSSYLAVGYLSSWLSQTITQFVASPNITTHCLFQIMQHRVELRHHSMVVTSYSVASIVCDRWLGHDRCWNLCHP